MNSQFQEFSGELPHDLLQRAHRSQGELAWSQADAIAAIDGLEKAEFTLLGVEVWLASSSGPQMTGRFWTLDDRADASGPKTASDFVATFKWGPFDAIFAGREPLFNLTVAEKRS